jgi:NAD+ synthase
MINSNLKINPEEEKQKIVSFLKKTFERQGFEKAVIGLSGGIDSITSFYLLREFLEPKDIIVAHLFDESPVFENVSAVLETQQIPTENIYLLSIKEPIDALANLLQLDGESDEQIRRGNIAARMRMITLFDLAKKHKALVTGTENKSEYLLSYFTRFGDQASDIEPIEHLYKTQVYQLAKHLSVPEAFITQKPTAGLWVGQTDEGEFGFTYEEADQVLHLALEKNMPVDEIKESGFQNAEKILAWRKRNLFKHETPYTL